MTQISGFWNGLVTGDATSAPYDADTEFANFCRRAFGVGANRANAGIVLNTGSESAQLEGLQVTQNSPASASVLVNIGAGLVYGMWYYTDTSEVVSVAANASGNPRIDTVVLRKSWAAQTVRIAILQGTPAGSPVPPTLTQTVSVTWEIPLADIAVANGFVSITNANITPRSIATNMADAIYLNRLRNNSGAVRQTGDAMIFDGTADRAVATTALANHNLTAGVMVGRHAAADLNSDVLNQGIGLVRTTAAVARGDFVGTSTTAGSLLGTSTQRLVNSVALMLETTTGAGLGLAYVDAGLKPNFGKLVINASTGTPALNVDNIPQFYPVYVIEIIGLSQIVATSEVLNMQFGSAGGGGARDTTATNYYSYLTFIGNSTPAVSATQNLGVTAGWTIIVPGSTAVNPAFYLLLQIKGVNGAANLKIGTGYGFFKNSNINGGLSVISFGGLWSNVVKALEQINIAGAGSNLSLSMNIFGKDGVTG